MKQTDRQTTAALLNFPMGESIIIVIIIIIIISLIHTNAA